ncbi:uncharacterized protein PFLUO_LOCUS5145 [Penicillium psychrofluorescens]|uniref:uncharacterized protein n=1 Tax=Penicillium psychrofluorescens TaxID=3158075 RepID=UPI003CCE1D61
MAPGVTTSPAQSSATTNTNSHVGKPSQQLFHHSLITTDFDPLKFRGAAALQWQLSKNTPNIAALETDTRLIASPYNDVPHLLDLETLDTQDRLLALALTALRPIRDDYATAPYTESFNWDDIFSLVRTFADAESHTWTQQSFYVVVFRSKLQPDADADRLYALDAHSHQEAIASGGLLKYWFGSKDQDHQNLATCVWRSRADARLGGRGPWHAKARMAARELYKNITFSTQELVVGDGAKSWTVRDWKDDTN